MTLALRPFLVFCADRLFTHSAAPHCEKKVQYLADRDVLEVTRFQEMLTQVPKS